MPISDDVLDDFAAEVQRLFREPRVTSGPPERNLVLREHPAKPGHMVAATAAEHGEPRQYEREFHRKHGGLTREQYDREHADDGERIAHPPKFSGELIVHDGDGRRLLRGEELEEYARRKFAALFGGAE